MDPSAAGGERQHTALHRSGERAVARRRGSFRHQIRKRAPGSPSTTIALWRGSGIGCTNSKMGAVDFGYSYTHSKAKTSPDGLIAIAFVWLRVAPVPG